MNVPKIGGFYTLINTYWGAATPSYLSIKFNFSDSTSYTKSFFGDTDIRDFNPGSFTNSVNGTTTVNVYSNTGGPRLDRQYINLAAAGHAGKTLTSVVLTDSGNSGVQRGFLVGATAVSIPEPTTASLLLTALLPLVYRRRQTK